MDLDQLVKAVDPARDVGVEWPDIERLIARERRRQPVAPISLSRTARSSRPAWLWLGVIALLASVLVLGIKVLPSSKSSDSTPKPGPGATTTMPAEMVGWASNSQIEVVSSTTGKVIRTLARDDGLYRGTVAVTVSRFGVVYFDEAENVDAVPTEQIREVPLAGGPVTILTKGHDPAISPNGELLAYLTYTDLSDAPQGIAVRNLLDGTTREWAYSTTMPDIGRLSWAPDSRSLSFTTTTPGGRKSSLILRAWVLDLDSASRSLARARQIPLPSDMAWVGYSSQTEGIGVVQHLGLTRSADWFEITQVVVSTGRIIKQLATFPGSLEVDNVYDGAEGTLQLDLSRSYLSIVEVGRGNGSLYRWKIGDGPIIPVATGIVTAGWVPSSPGATRAGG